MGRRLDRKNIDYDIYCADTAGDGAFLPDVRVTTATSTLGRNDKLGVWNGLAAAPDGVIAACTDLRSGSKARIFAPRGQLQP
jgi:hypothetical protein